MYHSPYVREPKTGFQGLDFVFFLFFFGQWNLDFVFQSLVRFRIPQGVLPISKPRIWDSRFDGQKFRGFWNPDILTRGVCFIHDGDVMN